MLRLLGGRKSEDERRDELLSAYLDGELDERERERLEARLSQDPALRAELRTLHQTVSMVRELPQTSAPRNFILSESMVRRREPAPAPEPRRAWAAPLLTAATTVVSLLFVVVLVGDLLLSGMGGQASAPEPMLQAEEAAPMATEVTETGEVESEQMVSPTLPPAASPEALEEAPDTASEERAEQELSPAEATRAAQAPPGAGATPPPATAGEPTEEPRSLSATVPPTLTGKSVLTPTIPPEEPVVSEGERGLLEPTPGELDVTPPPVWEEDALRSDRLPWRALEIALGLATVVLTVATVQAWRSRHG